MRSAQPSMKPKALNPRQKVALQLTLDGLPKNEICDRLGITQKTLWNWRRLPSWSETLDVALKDESSDGNTLVRTYYPMAVGILRKLALTGNDSIKLGACRTLVDAHTVLVAREEQSEVIRDLEVRLEEIAAAGVQSLAPAIAAEVIDAELEPVQSTGPSASSTGTQEAV